MFRAFKWLAKATIQTATGNAVLALLALTIITTASAATLTSYDVTNEPQMNLDVSINGTQTTGIILSTPQLNAADWTFASTTGAVLRIRWGVYREDIYATGATINATTKKVTLVGVTRNLCPQVARSYVSCGDGRSWGKGAIVELIQDARLFNLKANIDRANTYSALQTFASGATLTGSGYSFGLSRLTTTERDALTGLKGGELIYNKTTSLVNQYIGGVWTAVGTDATANATVTTSGKVELATTTDILNGTLTGDSGGPTVIWVSNVTRTSTGTTQANKIPVLGTNGRLPIALGGTASGSYTQSGILIGNGTSAFTQVLPGSAGNFLKSNGQEWVIGSGSTTDKIQRIYVPVSTATGTNMATTHYFNSGAYTIPANDLVEGVVYEVSGVITATITQNRETYTPCVAVGQDASQTLALTIQSSNRIISFKALIFGTTTASAASTIKVESTHFSNTSTGNTFFTTNTPTVATNGPLTIRLCGRYEYKNSDASATVQNFIVRKLSSTEF